LTYQKSKRRRSISTFNIPKIIVDVIKNQARLSENEIYGWLIGYQKNTIPNVIAIIECNKFEQQTLISAVPNAQEFQDFSTIMPQGIGPIGIYHSHPFSSDIFHSHTDDKTLISLSNQFSNCVSLVTNGKEINYYQMGKNQQINEIRAQFNDPQSLRFLLVSMNIDLEIQVDSNLLTDENYDKKLKIKILNRIKEYLEKIWINLGFYYQNTKIAKQDSIDNYLANNLFDEPIHIKIPQNLNNLNILISDNLTTESIFQNNIKLKLGVKTPIYIVDQKKYFYEINQAIKIELLSNNILQKIYFSILSDNKSSILLPNDFYIKFFEFYIRFLYFDNPEMNENKLSSKNFEFIYKLISLIENFASVQLDKRFQEYIAKFLTDIENFSIKFQWQKKLKKKILSLKKEYKF